MRDTTQYTVVSHIFENISKNSGNIEKYLTENCSGGANNKFFLNLFIKCWAGFTETSSTFDEQVPRKIYLVWNGLKCTTLNIKNAILRVFLCENVH